jgi:hypothetical protein
MMTEPMDATALLAADPAGLSGVELSERLIALNQLRSRVEAALVATVDVWDARAVWAVDGATSGVAWIAHWCQQSASAAGRLVELARRLRSMRSTAAAFVTGDLSTAKVDLLVEVAVTEGLAEPFARDEADLVAAIAGLTVDEAARTIRTWGSLVDPAAFASDVRRRWTRRGLELVQQADGRWTGELQVDAEGGAVVAGALDRIVDDLLRAAPGIGSELIATTPEQLRADALVDMARRATAVPDVLPPRPLLVVFVDATSSSGHPLVGLVDAGDPIPPVAVQRLACDAAIASVRPDQSAGGTEPHDVAVRTVTDAEARAMWVRDGGCVFPGCDRPPVACEAHQIPSVPDGAGDLADLCLVCAAHHRLLHEGGFGVSRTADGRLPFVRPDGSPLLGPRHRLDLYGRLFGHPPHA